MSASPAERFKPEPIISPQILIELMYAGVAVCDRLTAREGSMSTCPCGSTSSATDGTSTEHAPACEIKRYMNAVEAVAKAVR